MNKTEFYRASLSAEHKGLRVYIEKWVSFHESEYYAWCVLDFNIETALLYSGNKGSLIKSVKNVVQVKRIDKRSSRFAFNTENLAVENLRFRKSRQIRHLKRELEFANAFLKNDISDSLLVAETKDLVNSHYVFD